MYMHIGVHVCWKPVCVQSEKSLFLPCTIWTPGIELRFSGLVADVFSYQIIFLALVNIFTEYILNLYVSYSV